MKVRLIAMRQLGLVAALTTLTCVALGASRLTAVEFTQGQGDCVTLDLRTTGGPPEVTTMRFPEAHQGVLVLKQTELSLDQRTWNSPSVFVSNATLRSLEGPGGVSCVQMTLDLSPGVDFQVKSEKNGVKITIGAKVAATSQTAPTQPILLSNADLLSDAPLNGHGQDSPAADVMKGFQFYTPEVMPKEAPKTQEERDLLLAEEIFQQRVTLDFKDAQLQDVIRMLAARTNMNIILSGQTVKGSISLKLSNVPLGTALDAILKANGLAYVVERGGIVRIVPLSQVRTERVETKTEYLTVNWVTAQNLVDTLEPFLSKEGTIKADMESNGIIVTDVPSKVEQISRLIEQIDVPEKQVMIEARLVDLTEAAERELGINWQLYKNAENRATDPGTADETRNIFADSLMRRGPSAESVTKPNSYQSLGNTFSIFGNSYMLDYALEAMEDRRQATVLANPKIITLNNLMARIEIIRQEPYISAQQTSQNAIGTVEFKETGVILEVVPNITNNGYVRMSLKPEQKVRKGDFEGFKGFIPIIDERLVESSVIVKDEETVVLGGLRQIDNTRSESGWPFLMRVPVLGWLFKTEKTKFEKNELVLFVTPHIVKDPALSTEQLRQYEQIDYNWDLPDYFYDETELRTEPKEDGK